MTAQLPRTVVGSLGFAVIYVVPAAWVLGWALGGAWPLAVPVLVFGLIPALDAALGHDTHNADEDEVEIRARNPVYDGLLRLWVPTQLLILGAGVARAASGAPPGELLLLAVATGVLTGGGGINIAHELMHRRRKLDKALAEVLMTSVTYPWFCVEHVLGHHRNVATPDDPATSRFGESVYAFLPRVLWGSLASAWRLERDRVARRKIATFGPGDRRARYAVWLVATYGALALIGGWPAVLFFAVQSVVAILLLEVINYVEHYGLVREQLPGGRYERVQPHHSWNSAHALTGRFLFNLPRHADHHAWASRPYWQLRHWDDAPQMPVGYATMVLVALIPPLWHRIMDPRVATVRRAPPGPA